LVKTAPRHRNRIRPLRDWPPSGKFVLDPLLEAIRDDGDCSNHARSRFPAIRSPFKIVIEKRSEARAKVCIKKKKMSPMLDPMHFEPLLSGGRSHEKKLRNCPGGANPWAAPIRAERGNGTVTLFPNRAERPLAVVRRRAGAREDGGRK